MSLLCSRRLSNEGGIRKLQNGHYWQSNLMESNHWNNNEKIEKFNTKLKKVRVCTMSILSPLRLSNEGGIRKLQNRLYRQTNVMECNHWKSDGTVKNLNTHKTTQCFGTYKN